MVLNGLKQYQEALLDAFAAYLARCRELKDPGLAFAESTQAHFGHALPYHPLPGADAVPYVCLRVPTGGGKTRLAGQAIKRVNDAFLATEHALVLWLVPSDPIREQTLRALKTPGELLHQDMRDLFGAVHVLDINEALYLQPATLNTGNTLIVATMQSFKRDTAEGLRVYRQNGALMPHFDGVSPEQRGEHSLVDVIRLRRPFVIVDEAHNQGTPLAVDTLTRFNPACILELTATPDRANQPSNVLRSVSAATLQAEDMLKLPLELAIHPEWRVSLTEAIARLRQLEKEAELEKQQTGETIKPVVMLIQAERKAGDKETFTPERVRQHLIEDFNIPAETIAIATGAVDELTGKTLDDPDYPQFIITVDKLREGWDCPYAYVLFSFRNTTSATAVEQVLGRVLRMPHVTRKQQEALNRSYAYVVSSELAATVQGLRDGLVQSGFERLETKDLIRAADDTAPMGDLFAPQGDLVIPLPAVNDAVAVPDETALLSLPKALRDKVEVSPESGTLTVKGGASPKQIQQLAETFKEPETAKVVRERLDTAQAVATAPPARMPTPAERGEKATVPLLGYTQYGFFDVFDETPLLDADWEITDFDPKLTESEFAHDVEAMRRASLSISQLEKIECDVYDRLDSQLALFGAEDGWTVNDLIYWLDRNLYFPYSERDQKVAWLGAALDRLLQQRGFSLDELAYRKFRLRGALQRKIAAGLVQAKQRVFDGLFADESGFAVRDEHSIVLEQGRYAYDFQYTGFIPLKRHFFPVIGNLKNSGEEFECAEFIANQLEGVAWWVRNVERKPTSFWLQTASDRFYPDFLVQMANGPLVAIEYKGAHIADGRDSQEKQRIGDLWARRSEGRCRFVWVENRQWQRIEEHLK
ncbi:DEAD/DEAH box helicase [Methylococcus sp. Mc7]|uniref:DEAD/DEAH box helicase n=1 Tax=Methylococcus sp. Mc7 TaxID=2860258 RepID=UPI001C52D4E0|nr:DEAD/DEAH box helicase family protein [Methylococcus sp. Mc7]QXP85818.1 DEAD/DEAH box helicase family protein [Methylococcus sp. Mc7]